MAKTEERCRPATQDLATAQGVQCGVDGYLPEQPLCCQTACSPLQNKNAEHRKPPHLSVECVLEFWSSEVPWGGRYRRVPHKGCTFMRLLHEEVEPSPPTSCSPPKLMFNHIRSVPTWCDHGRFLSEASTTNHQPVTMQERRHPTPNHETGTPELTMLGQAMPAVSIAVRPFPRRPLAGRRTNSRGRGWPSSASTWLNARALQDSAQEHSRTPPRWLVHGHRVANGYDRHQ